MIVPFPSTLEVSVHCITGRTLKLERNLWMTPLMGLTQPQSAVQEQIGAMAYYRLFGISKDLSVVFKQEMALAQNWCLGENFHMGRKIYIMDEVGHCTQVLTQLPFNYCRTGFIWITKSPHMGRIFRKMTLGEVKVIYYRDYKLIFKQMLEKMCILLRQALLT